MKRFLLAVMIMGICTYIAGGLLSLPWWLMALICFIVAINFKMPGGASFLAGFTAIFLLWLIVALIKDTANEQILSTRMAQLFHLNNPYLFMFAAALAGGIIGGLSAWSGALMQTAFGRKAYQQ